MKPRNLFIAIAMAGVWSGAALAANVTPDVIFGSGNANGSFTIGTGGGVELGLRGKLRYNTAGAPENTFNNTSGNLYEFETTDGVAPANRSIWNFEWSINTTDSGLFLDDLTYAIAIDFDPTAAVSPVAFDPINVGYADHSIGTNLTGNGGGVEAADAAGYAALIDANTVAQNSWNLGFFVALAPSGFDPQTEGLYTISLAAFDGLGAELASTSIDVRYGSVPAPVPLPAALPMLAAALGGLALLGRRKLAA